MQEQELGLLRTEVAALKDSQRRSPKAKVVDSVTVQDMPASLQPAEGAKQGRIVKGGSGGQPYSKIEMAPSGAKEEMGTIGPAMSQGDASLDSRSPVEIGKYQKPADGAVEDIGSRPRRGPAQQDSLDGAHAVGKRQRSLPHPLVTPESALQPVADTPDELEVGPCMALKSRYKASVCLFSCR